jgi:hypothetical protein
MNIKIMAAWGVNLKLRAEGNKLWDEGDKLRAEGNKLRAEGDKLWAEGRIQLASTILDVLGNVKMEWDEDGLKIEGQDKLRFDTEPIIIAIARAQAEAVE